MRVCLITTGQPASNPRLVKEADALAATGLDVHVIGAYWADWATAEDARLMAGRAWTFTFLDWRRETEPALFWRTRIRQYVASSFVGWPVIDRWAVPAATSRLTPELSRAALAWPADLYIAHNLGALPAAATAARTHRARLMFDAEDFHRGQFGPDEAPRRRRLVERVERALLPRCHAVTASSPAIARAYAPFCAVEPVTVLNVFPVEMRPASRRETTSGGPLTLYWFSQTIGPGRGLEDVIRVMGRCVDGTIELHLRGRVQAGYDTVLAQVMDESRVHPSRVIVHPPAAPSEMVRLAAAYDVGLALEPGVPENNDLAASNKLFTYLLAGNAILATRTTGQRAVLEQIGSAGAMVEPGDLNGMTAALSVWLNDRSQLDAARLESWGWGAIRYNWDVERDRLVDLAFSVLRPEPATSRTRASVRLSPARSVSPQP